MRRRYLVLLAAVAIGIAIVLLARRDVDPAVDAGSSPRAAIAHAAPAPPPHVSDEPANAHGSFSGHVFDAATGAGVANAQLTFTTDAAASIVETDPSGAFTFEPVSAGRHVVSSVSAAGYLPFAPDAAATAMAFVARPGVRIADVAVYLTPDVELVASVVDARDAPVAGASVAILDGASTSHVDTDAAGHARIHAVEHALVEARHPSLGTGRARIGARDMVSRSVSIKLGDAPSPSGRITGRVVDTAGAAVSAPFVRGINVAVAELHPGRETHGGDDGRFVLDGLDAGLHVIWVVCDRCISSRVRANTGDEITLVVGAGSAVRGRVVEAGDGKPIPAFTVALDRPRGRRDVTLEEHVVVDADGRFEFLGVPADDYHIVATASGHTPAHVDVTVGDTSPPELVVRLGGSGAIRGTVVDRATGVGVSGAAVSVDRAVDVDSALIRGVVAATDASGAFILDNVPFGPHSVRVIADGHHTTLVGNVRVDAGAVAGPIEVRLAPLVDGEPPQIDTCGIGAVIAGSPPSIAEIIPDGGAQRAGLVEGDEIVAIDGKPSSAMTMQDALDSIRGVEGSYVVLSVRRGTPGVSTDVSVERRVFRRAEM